MPQTGPRGDELAATFKTDGVSMPDIEGSEIQDGPQQRALVGSLQPHPLIAEIYGSLDAEQDNLLESAREQGILTPLLVTPGGIVLAGAERLRVAQFLNMEHVPVRVLDLTDEAEIEQAVIESNVARRKTIEQRIREFRQLKRLEAGKAAKRQGTRTDLLENLPGSEAGSARDVAAAKVNWSGRTAEKGDRVLGVIEERAAAGANMHDVEELRDTLRHRSIDAAHQRALELGWIEDPAARRKAERSGTPERRIAGVYKQATTAVSKLASIFKGEDAASFTPEQNRQLRETLTPVLKWVDNLGQP